MSEADAERREDRQHEIGPEYSAGFECRVREAERRRPPKGAESHGPGSSP
jgi:hypothetical protein